MAKRRLGLFLSVSYLMLYLLSLLLSFGALYQSRPSAMWGVAAELASVWGLVLTPMLDAIGYISWYDSLLSHSRFQYGFFATLPATLAALVNTLILYKLGKGSKA